MDSAAVPGLSRSVTHGRREVVRLNCFLIGLLGANRLHSRPYPLLVDDASSLIRSF